MIDIRCGDCRDILPTLPDQSVHCCITSPPYWGLRDYGLPPSVWGGDADCEHEWYQEPDKTQSDGMASSSGAVSGGLKKRGQGERYGFRVSGGSSCHLCGAWRGCLGLEPTPELYVEHLVGILRQVRRVLRDDGTLWLVLGDSYAGGNYRGGGVENASNKQRSNAGTVGFMKRSAPAIPAGLKPKDLAGIPWRVAFALQADGWWLRSDIIWHKPNCMPESVKDRPTRSHEYVFLLSKSARYWYDADAIREPSTERPSGNIERRDNKQLGSAAFGVSIPYQPNGTGRNRRTVWTVPTKPFKGAHFATFPPDLIEPMVRAGCPEGGTILDPFAGAGTVGIVAKEWNRNAILIELNPEYLEMAEERMAQVQPRLII